MRVDKNSCDALNENCFLLISFEDVDECAEADQGGCEFKCSNYEGGYYCSCDVGYRLMDDDKSCEGKFTTTLPQKQRSDRSGCCCMVGVSVWGLDVPRVSQNPMYDHNPYCICFIPEQKINSRVSASILSSRLKSISEQHEQQNLIVNKHTIYDQTARNPHPLVLHVPSYLIAYLHMRLNCNAIAWEQNNIEIFGMF